MRTSDSFASYADLRARVRHTVNIQGPYELHKDFLVLPIKVPENSLVEDGQTVELLSEPLIEVRSGTVLAVDVNPQIETVGLVTYRHMLTGALVGARPLVIRVEAECAFDINDFEYLARLYVFR